MKHRIKNIEFLEQKETAAVPHGQGRGFYRLIGVMVHDETAEIQNPEYLDVQSILLEINLCDYRYSRITSEGLSNIHKVLEQFHDRDTLIVRFLYDQEGNGFQHEPSDIHIIKTHMQQLQPLLEEYKDSIFLIQGLFTGSWGEMNNTHFSSDADMTDLAETLDAATPKEIFLSVRTPAQWRILKQNSRKLHMSRFGIYNDGMMGSLYDLGTFGITPKLQADYTSSWSRNDELDFIDETSLKAPYGGEAVGTAACSNFTEALQYLRKTHATYLNEGYDEKTLARWKESRIEEDSVYAGMNGLDYIGAMLGYRYFLEKAELTQHRFTNRLEVTATVVNRGFAPCYRADKAQLVIQNSEHTIVYDMDGRINAICNHQSSIVKANIPNALPAGEYAMYIRLLDDHGRLIGTANEQYNEQNGVLIARLSG